MIIWIDGTYGVGKTAVAMKIKESFSDDNIELLESDYYSNELLKRVVEEAKANNSFPHIGGTLPQNNKRFLREFRELIEEKSNNTDKNLIVDMALTMKECKEDLFDYLKSNGKSIVHIILTADEDTIKSRIKKDGNRMKETALEWLTQNIAFLDKNFPDAIRIKTDNRDIDDIVTEVILKILLGGVKMGKQNINEQYKQLAEKMQKIVNDFPDNFHVDSVFPQMKIILDSISSLTIFSLSEKTIAFIEEAKASENLSHEDFLDKYGEEIDICKTVGQAGWVVSEHSNPRKIKEWYQLILQGKEKEIIAYFDADDSHMLKSIRNNLAVYYEETHSCRYYNKGMEAYDKNDYMTAAMYLVALLESRINDYMNYPRRTPYSKKYSEEGFEQHLSQEFLKANSFFTKRFLFLDMYPSLIEYLNRLFVDGIYTFESKKEPPYINRNWLLHGKCARDIERFECIQILNALSVIEFLFKVV